MNRSTKAVDPVEPLSNGAWVPRFAGRKSILRTRPSWFCGKSAGLRYSGVLLAAVLVSAGPGVARCRSQEASPRTPPVSIPATQAQQQTLDSVAGSISKWQGLPVRRISFEGVDASRLDPLPGHLAQTEGAPLEVENLQKSLRQLFATGLFETIQVEGQPLQDGVELIFRGTPRSFIGNVSVDGAKGATINAQLDRASQLNAGTRFTPAKLNQALANMRQTLEDNGFMQAQISHTIVPHPESQLVDIAFHVVSGPQARIGRVEVTGESGMSVDEFRHHARLRTGAHVDHDTVNRALSGVLKHYQKQNRLEAEIKLESEPYDPSSGRTSFHFTANQGPVVRVQIQGVNMSQERIRRVIPIYEEGTVDEDLLMEGNRRLRDYYQRLGYFDVRVDHRQQTPSTALVDIFYNVELGPRRRVARVSIEGNHYFDTATLKELLSIHAADSLDHHGSYSQALVSADTSALQAVYQNNGFSKVKVTVETSTPETAFTDNQSADAGQHLLSTGTFSSASGKVAPLIVTYHIDEGEQLRVSSVRIEGADQAEAAKLIPQLNTAPGQLLSPQNLAGDRDAIVTDYLSRGFEHPQVDVTEQPDAADADKVEVVFRVTEGPQVFVRNVLLTGIHFTRPDTVSRAITIHAGAPMNQTALLDTQRNLYEFALFNEVDTAVENPNGDATRKTVLIQATEARRWALTYGFGFEAQTGTPHYNCGLIILSGAPCNTTGKTGVSPRVLADITRNNLFGRELSASIQGNYGLLEQKLDVLFQDPHLNHSQNFSLSFSGSYANSLDVTTYVASRLQGGMRLSQHFEAPNSLLSKANSFIYEFNFRRVKVQANSLQISPGEIATESAAVRVAGPAITWLRDTRDSVLDAHRGTYTSFQEFLSNKVFGAQAVFNRIDVSNSSFKSFDKGQLVLARNTRYGQERAFGTPGTELIPLPERLYAGGYSSLRGFSINAAGPRDPETGFPIGGAGAFINSTELRLPPPVLPYFGNSLSFVLFHDMGNVFASASQIWPAAIRTRQPDKETCQDLNIVNPNHPDAPIPPVTSIGWLGMCRFDYFSHALGIGLRYHTPVGPIRLDFSYNLNPPIFPVIYNYSNPTALPTVGEASHFNFFFSLGQAF
jgi:outer membrane protein insertion porin family